MGMDCVGHVVKHARRNHVENIINCDILPNPIKLESIDFVF